MKVAVSLWTSFSRSALEWIYPSKCALCGLLEDTSPCETCRSQMYPAEPNFVGELGGDLSYRACVFAYSGRAAQAVRKLKYGRNTSLADFMSAQIAERICQISGADDLLIPVPIHKSRRSLRGFNQAEICAAGDHGLELRSDVFHRVRATRPQAGLSLKERQKNLENAFAAGPEVDDRDIILIDDVVTSGHTARECAKVLVAAGARSVGVIAFCGNLD